MTQKIVGVWITKTENRKGYMLVQEGMENLVNGTRVLQ